MNKKIGTSLLAIFFATYQGIVGYFSTSYASEVDIIQQDAQGNEKKIVDGKEISEWRLKEVPDDAKGTFSEGTKTMKYVYERVEGSISKKKKTDLSFTQIENNIALMKKTELGEEIGAGKKTCQMGKVMSTLSGKILYGTIL